jgi:hypothetical protein
MERTITKRGEISVPKNQPELFQEGSGNWQAGRDINYVSKEDDISVPELDAIVKKFASAAAPSRKRDFKIIGIKEKNKLNGISEEYYREIRIDSVYGYEKIEALLKDPLNVELIDDYENIAIYLKQQYLLSNLKGKMERFIFKAIENFGSHETSIKEKIWGNRLLNFMYLRCDIGLK